MPIFGKNNNANLPYKKYWSLADRSASNREHKVLYRTLKRLKNIFENNLNITIHYTRRKGPFSSFPIDKSILSQRSERLAAAVDVFLEQLSLKRSLLDIKRDVEDYDRLIQKWSYKNLDGGLGYNNGLFLYAFARAINPNLYIESGVLRGFSTYIVSAGSCSDCKIYAYDIDLGNIIYRSPKATYFEQDISKAELKIDGNETLIFFDDHVSHYERLRLANLLNIRFMVFDDDVSLLNMHSEESPPLPTINMLLGNKQLPAALEWTVNGRSATADFSSIAEKFDPGRYIYVSAPDLFEITGYHNSSTTSYLIRCP